MAPRHDGDGQPLASGGESYLALFEGGADGSSGMCVHGCLPVCLEVLLFGE